MSKTFLRLAGGGLIVLGIGLAVMGINLFTLPNSYEAVLRLKVDKNFGDVSGLSVERRGFDPYWMQDQFETLQSKTILYCVITNLNLNHKWAERLKMPEPLQIEVAYAQLKKQIEVRQPRSTSLIEIKIESEDEEEAIAIANEIADAYRELRVAQWREANRIGVKVLEAELEKRNREVEALKLSSGTNVSDARALANLELIKEKLGRKVMQEKDASNGPRINLVEIIDLPEPPLRRCHPQKRFAIVAVLGGLGAVGIGLVMLRAGADCQPLHSIADPGSQ